MYVCVCKAVTERQLLYAINEGACTRKQLFQCLGVGAECGKCNLQVKTLLNTALPKAPIIPSNTSDLVFNP